MTTVITESATIESADAAVVTELADWKPQRRESIVKLLAPPIVVFGLVVGLWYFVSYVVLDDKRRFLLVPPHQVWTDAFADGDVFSEMLGGVWSSGKVAIWGLALAIVIGFLIAIVMSQSKLIERGVFPLTVVMQATPILAIVPLIGFWFGYGFQSRVLVAVLIALFPIVVNTLFGLLSADQGLHDILTLHGASRLTRLRKVQFPAALPAIFAGLRISAGLAVIGAIVGDFFFGQGEVGIGQLLKRYAAKLQGAELLGAVILSCSMGVAVFISFGWLSNRVVGKWTSSVRGK